MYNLNVGDTLTIQKKVTNESAALNYGSGELKNLFATPSLVALMIEGSTQLVDPKLDEGLISVGKVANVTHEKPTVIGETITLEVKINEIKDNKIVLNMKAYDEIGLIGFGQNERYIVNKKGLLDRAMARERKLKNLDY